MMLIITTYIAKSLPPMGTVLYTLFTLIALIYIDLILPITLNEETALGHSASKWRSSDLNIGASVPN